MILYELKCGQGHGFEAWFKDGAAYETQAAVGEISCPVCGDGRVGKAPMAPRIGRARQERTEKGGGAPAEAPPGEQQGEGRSEMAVRAHGRLAELRRRIEESCDYVGDRFAEEARRIHYGEVQRRDIYGQASDAEARELAEEGVEFSRIPWVPRGH
jgi:hypothetical protein